MLQSMAAQSILSNGETSSDDGCESRPTPPGRSVSFSKVQVRDYGITVGDNPGGAAGAPVTLGWAYDEHAPLGVDHYEEHRPGRRSRDEMYMPPSARNDMLLQGVGISRSEMLEAQKQADRIRKQRARTKAWMPLERMEDVLESATRKAKRIGKVVGGRGEEHRLEQYNDQPDKATVVPRRSSADCLRSYSPLGTVKIGSFSDP